MMSEAEQSNTYQRLISNNQVADQATQETVRAIRVGLIVLFIAFGCLGSWVAFAPLHGAVIAPGQIKVESTRKTIQHLEGGIIDQILVKEGAFVQTGQPLIILESTRVSAEVALLQDQFDIAKAQISRLEAEKMLSGSIQFPAELIQRYQEPKVKSILDGERKLFETHRRILQSQIALIQNQIAQSSREKSALETQVSATNRSIQYLQDELTLNEGLAAKGFVASPKLLEFKRSIAQQQSVSSESMADIERTQQKSSELKLRIASLQNEYIKRAADELTQTQEKVFDLNERLRVPNDQLSRQTISSPVAGRVVALKVHTKGGVISPGQPLMDVVPVNSEMLIEIKVNIQDIEEVHTNMTAEVRLTAYKQRETPLIKGSVTYVSADSLLDEVTRQPYYLAHVSIRPETLRQLDSSITLYPGMPAEVYILTKERTALEYLLDPILQTVRHAMRET